jgi:hypothetical protein
VVCGNARRGRSGVSDGTPGVSEPNTGRRNREQQPTRISEGGRGCGRSDGANARGASPPPQGLKALFLEGNAIDSLEGLSSLTGLRCLYMQQNCITEIEEGTLDMLTDLRQLNLRCGVLNSRRGGL